MMEDPPSLKLPTSLTAAAEAMAVRKLPASPSAMPRQFDGQDGGQDGMVEERKRIQNTGDRIGETNTEAETRRSLLRRSNVGYEGRAGHGQSQKEVHELLSS